MQTARSGARLSVLPERDDRSGEEQGFLLVDASSRLLCANDEADRILTFPEIQKPRINLAEAFYDKIWVPLLRGLISASSPNDVPLCSQFKSGRRSYLCRAYTLNGDGDGSNEAPVLVVLERAVARPLNLGWVFNRLHLTPREQEVVAFLLDGLCNKDIADRMAISVYAVKTYLRAVAARLEASSRAEIVAKVFRVAKAYSDAQWKLVSYQRGVTSDYLSPRKPLGDFRVNGPVFE